MQEEQGIWIFDIQLGAFEEKHTHTHTYISIGVLRQGDLVLYCFYLTCSVLFSFSEPCSFGSWLAGCVFVYYLNWSLGYSYTVRLVVVVVNTSSLYP